MTIQLADNIALSAEIIGTVVHLGAGTGGDLPRILQWGATEIVLVEALREFCEDLRRIKSGKATIQVINRVITKGPESAMEFAVLSNPRWSCSSALHMDGIEKPGFQCVEKRMVTSVSTSDLLEDLQLPDDKANLLIVDLSLDSAPVLSALSPDHLQAFSYIILMPVPGPWEPARNIDLDELLPHMRACGFVLEHPGPATLAENAFCFRFEPWLQRVQNEIQQLGKENQELANKLTIQERNHSKKVADYEYAKELGTSNDKNEKPVLRLLHHLACSGGSLISKCIMSMPNTYLLSEAHPLRREIISTEVEYAPSDIARLAMYASIENFDRLSDAVFRQSFDACYKHVENLGSSLVVRDHSHSDFFRKGILEEPTVSQLLSPRYSILAVVTVRHPLDIYLSLLENGWIHFHPPTFDEFCRRYGLFLDFYRGVSLLKYESLIRAPEDFMRKLCGGLDLEYDGGFTQIFSRNQVTGDSGRTTDLIEQRPRRVPEKTLQTQMKESDNYRVICERLEYDLDLPAYDN